MALAAGVVEVTAGGTGAVAMEVAAMVVATEAAVMAEAVPVEETVGAAMEAVVTVVATAEVAMAGVAMAVVTAVAKAVVERAAEMVVRHSPRRRSNGPHSPRTTHRIGSPLRRRLLQQRASLLLSWPAHRYIVSLELVLDLQTVRLSMTACPCSFG